MTWRNRLWTKESAAPLAIKVVLGFWALHLVYRTTIAALSGAFDELFHPAIDIALVLAFALSFVFCAILDRLVRRGLAYALIATAFLAFPMSLLHAGNEVFLYYNSMPLEPAAAPRDTHAQDSKTAAGNAKGRSERQMLLDRAVATVFANTTAWYFFFFGLGSLFVGMQSAADVRESERRVAQYQRLAQQFQLEALRYQVNPHFLFNTLNALSALIMTGRTEAAERMILNLSSFFRQTLAIDPADDIPLGEELTLQRLYLDIEGVRFPDRLAVAIDAPPETLDAPIPALLLQPLVENAIKHGVARSGANVTIRIAATRAHDRLVLVVENETGDGEAAPPAAPGTGTGLRNVRDRLLARYGDTASCTAGPDGPGRFRVTLDFPLTAP